MDKNLCSRLYNHVYILTCAWLRLLASFVTLRPIWSFWKIIILVMVRENEQLDHQSRGKCLNPKKIQITIQWHDWNVVYWSDRWMPLDVFQLLKKRQVARQNHSWKQLKIYLFLKTKERKATVPKAKHLCPKRFPHILVIEVHHLKVGVIANGVCKQVKLFEPLW